jgi:hypothetical protein
VPRRHVRALRDEAAALLAFAEPGAETTSVRLA